MQDFKALNWVETKHWKWLQEQAWTPMLLTFPWIFEKARTLKLRFKGSHDHGKNPDFDFFLHLLNTQSICIKKSCNIYPMIHRSLDFGTDTWVNYHFGYLPSGHGYCPMLINHKMITWQIIIATLYIVRQYLILTLLFSVSLLLFQCTV